MHAFFAFDNRMFKIDRGDFVASMIPANHLRFRFFALECGNDINRVVDEFVHRELEVHFCKKEVERLLCASTTHISSKLFFVFSETSLPFV